MGSTRRAHHTTKRRPGKRRPGAATSRYLKSQSNSKSDTTTKKVRRPSQASQSKRMNESHPSRQSSEAASDIAAEIIVWTDDMDLDNDGRGEGEVGESGIEIKTENSSVLDQPASR
jgi:hypothetical protein